jgi:hypothetical protein
MKRIIRQSGPRATNWALAMEKWREEYSEVDVLTASRGVIKAMHDEISQLIFTNTNTKTRLTMLYRSGAEFT